MSTSSRFYMEMDAISENEGFARVCIAAFCARLDPTLEEINDIKTAVSEAVTNSIIHGYKKQGGIIHINADIDENMLTICISDDGCGIEDVTRRWNRCIQPEPWRSVREWDLHLWRYSWTICMWNRNRVRGRRLL